MADEPRIVLTGMGPKLSGLTWETDRGLRIGKQSNLDVVLRDFSVAGHHAEVKHHGMRWILRDLARNTMFPTMVNGVCISGRDKTLQCNDIIQIGKLQLKVTELVTDQPALAYTPLPSVISADGVRNQRIVTSGAHMLVKAKMQQTWDQALKTVTQDPVPHPNQEQAMLALVRANHHMTHLSQIDELLKSILSDTVGALSAKRGSIVLADPSIGALRCRATVSAKDGRPGGPVRPFSSTLVKRCFDGGESILCDDVNTDEALALSRGIRSGAMASVICALLRTPRKRIGVLHLDRGFLDDPFTEHDLYYADAIAASVAVGIETAQMVEQHRAEFIETVSALAAAVEQRDQYSVEHTRRVTDYSLMLAEELRLSSEEKYQIQVGTPLRDIGKIAIDDAILRKPGKLTEGEFESMKTHTTKGAGMLDSMTPLLPMIPIVKFHHERWDGTGYPDRLKQDQIPITARIVSIADAFEAMTCDRPYRPAMSTDRAFLELISRSGSHFDPNCVFTFMRVRQKIESRMKQK